MRLCDLESSGQIGAAVYVKLPARLTIVHVARITELCDPVRGVPIEKRRRAR